MTNGKPAVAQVSGDGRHDTGVPVWLVVIAVIVGGTIAHAVLHFRVHGVWNVTQIGLAFFLVLIGSTSKTSSLVSFHLLLHPAPMISRAWPQRDWGKGCGRGRL